MKIIFLIVLIMSSIFGVNFSKLGNIVTDADRGLQWQDDASIPVDKTWTNAITYCEGLTLDTYSDWRLPNIRELNTLVDDTRVTNTLYVEFQYSTTATFWSSTSYVSDATNGWVVRFSDATMNKLIKTDTSTYTRCVRGGQ